jgi:peptidyl-prolyl cis-trans isomerase C
MTLSRLPLRWIIGGLVPPILLLAVFLGCERREVGEKQGTGPVIVVLNGKPLYKKDFYDYLPEDYQRSLTLDEKRDHFDRWITTEILYEAAIESSIGVTPEIEARLVQFKKDLVVDRLVQKVIRDKAVVTEAEVRAYYKAHEDEYTREYRVSHILVNTLEDAETVKQLLQKHPFSWVARRYSIDRHTGVGGDLGYLSKGNMIPEFEEVVFDMKVGDVSDIIESEFGYHFVTVTSVREARNKLTYEDVAEDISKILLLEKRSAVYDSLITTMVTGATIEIVDPELKLAADLPPDSTSLSE